MQAHGPAFDKISPVTYNSPKRYKKYEGLGSELKHEASSFPEVDVGDEAHMFAFKSKYVK